MKKAFIILFVASIFASIIFITINKPKNFDTVIVREGKSLIMKEENTPPVSSLSIDYLRGLKVDSESLQIIEELTPGSNYSRYLASYISDSNKIFGLLTVPTGDVPTNGYSAVVFNHGYIPPSQYVTTEKYISYVDYLARSGFVVFKIDLRGHGESEGSPTGSYFSPGYTIDAISALRSLQKLDYVDAEKIGMWGHSMAGNLVLRAALIEPDIKASVIWSGAVYSYEDFAKYRLNDSSYVRSRPHPHYDSRDLDDSFAEEIVKLREASEEINFNDGFWSSVSLTKNIDYLGTPIQLHHAVNDSTVNIGYSRDLVEVLRINDKAHEFYEYSGGGHNIESPYFEQAMQRTVEFFRTNL